MGDAVDLSARTGGLLPLWLFLTLVLLWLGTILVAFRMRRDQSSEAPFTLIALGSLVLGNALFFWRPLFTAAHVPRGGGDLNSFFFTLHAYSAERIRDGELPLWNPTLHGGMPHLGNYQAGLLYPPNLISYLIANPFSYGTLEWLAILHYMIASIGVYLLIRSLGAGRTGAVAGGLIFAYGGFMVAHLGHYSMISVAAWVPWLLWVVQRLVRFLSWRWAALLAVITYLAATGGHQQTLLFALTATGIWWLFLIGGETGIRIPGIGEYADSNQNRHAWDQLRSTFGMTRLAQFAIGAGSGLALAAPMILPSLQLARRSVRSSLNYEQASEFSVQPVALLQLLLPTVFGSNPTDHWGAFSSGEIWGYAGVVTLVIALMAVLLRPTSHRLFFSGIAVLSLLYAVGPWSPVHGWVFQFVPLFDLVRAPARAYLFLNLSLAILAGLAVNDLILAGRRHGFRLQRVLSRLTRALAVVVAVTALFILPVFYTQILGVNDPPNRPVITVDNLWMMLVFLSLLLAILWAASRRAVHGTLLGLALAVLIVLDLFSATMPFNPTDEDLVSGYRDPAAIAYVQEEWTESEPFRIDVRGAPVLPNFGSLDGFHVAGGVFDPMQPAAFTTAYNVASFDGPAYDMVNVRFLLTGAGEEPPPGFERALETDHGVVIWERASALPRAWFVSEVRQLSVDASLNALRSPDFDPASDVILTEPVIAPDSGATGEVEIVSYEPERIVLNVDADGSGYLVLSEGAFPDWNATVDGVGMPVLTANHGLRAVAVNEETSTVELTYEPGLLTYGAVSAFLGLLAVLAMLVAPVLLSRRDQPDADNNAIQRYSSGSSS